MEVFISLIIPVYNAEKYLEQCLESAVNQSYSHYEILLVNDGSSDNSGCICLKYRDKYPFVRIIQHEHNLGLMQSWHHAVHVANGTFIAFLDSDDWVSRDYLKNMAAEAAAGAEIVCCNHNRVYGESVDFCKERIPVGMYDFAHIQQGIFPILLNDGTYLGRSISPHRCGKLFKKELLLNNLKYCDCRISYGEDLNIFFPAVQDCRKLSVLDDQEGLYYYRQNMSSIIHTHIKNMFEQIVCLRNCLLKSMHEKAVYDFRDQLNRDYWCMFLEYVKNEAKLGNHWKASKMIMQNYRASLKCVPYSPLFRKKSDYLLLCCLRSNSSALVCGWLIMYTIFKRI